MLEIVNSIIGEIPVSQVDSWLKRGIFHGFLGRELDFRFPVKSWPEVNKRGVRLCLLEQVHGIDIIDLDLIQPRSEILNADGWIGNLKMLEKQQIAIGIKTADCTPVLAVGNNRGVVMALHCGWRGAYDGLLSFGIKRMLEKGEKLDSIELAMGPAAQIGCYEVSADLAEKFETKLRSLINASEENLVSRVEAGKSFLSVSSYLEMEAISLGINNQNIAVSEDCTILEKKFFSYRREKDDSGRQLSFISA